MNGCNTCLSVTAALFGVQAAIASRPPRRQTRPSSAAAFFWSGANMTPKVEITASKHAIAEWQCFGITQLIFDRQALLPGNVASSGQHALGDVDANHVRAASRDRS